MSFLLYVACSVFRYLFISFVSFLFSYSCSVYYKFVCYICLGSVVLSFSIDFCISLVRSSFSTLCFPVLYFVLYIFLSVASYVFIYLCSSFVR